MIERIQNWDKNSYPPKASEVVEHDEFKALPPAGKIDTLNKLQAQWADVSSVDNKEDYPGIMRDMETWFGDQRKAIVKNGLAEDLAAGKLTQQQVQAYVTQGPDALDDAGKQHFMGRYGDPKALVGPWVTTKAPIVGADGKPVGFQYIRRRPGMTGQAIAENMGIPGDQWNQAGYVMHNAGAQEPLTWKNPDSADNIEVSWTVNGNDGKQYSGVEQVSGGEQFSRLADAQRSLAVYQGMGDPGMAGPSRETADLANLPDMVGSEGLPAALASDAVSRRLQGDPEIAKKIGQGLLAGFTGEAMKGLLETGAAAVYGPQALFGNKDAAREYQREVQQIDTDFEGQSRAGFEGGMLNNAIKSASKESISMLLSGGAGSFAVKRLGTAAIKSQLGREIANRAINAVAFLPSSMRGGLDNMTATLDAADELRKQGKVKEAQDVEDNAVMNGWFGTLMETASENMWLNEMMTTKVGRSFGDVVNDTLKRKIGPKMGKVAGFMAELLNGANQEGIEEIVSGVGNATWMNAFANQHKDVFGDVPADYIGGAIMGGVMEGGKKLTGKAAEWYAKATTKNVPENPEAASTLAEIRAKAEEIAANPKPEVATPETSAEPISSAPPPAPGADATLQTSPVAPVPVEPAGTGPSPELNIASGAESAELMTPDEFDGHPLAQQKYVEEMGKLDAAGVSPPPREFMLKAATAVAHKEQISGAINENKPVSAEAVDSYGIKLPDGYKRQGNLYVPTAPVEAPKAFAPIAPLPESKTADEVAKTLHDARSEAIDVANEASSVPGAEVTAEALASIAADEEAPFLDMEAARSGLTAIGEQVAPAAEVTTPEPISPDGNIATPPTEEAAPVAKTAAEPAIATAADAVDSEKVSEILDIAEKESRSRSTPVMRTETKGTDGKWYSNGFATGVSPTEETRSFWVSRGKDGVTYGSRYPTEEAWHKANDEIQAKKREDFQSELNQMPPDRIESQLAFWRGEQAKSAARSAPLPSAQKPAPKPASQTKPLGTGSAENDERLRNLRVKVKAGRGVTGSDEKLLKIYEDQAAADPSKWQQGDGVGYRVDRQVNRGFRVVKVDPETKLALVNPVADTGLTVTGGGMEGIGPTWVHVADLVRDKKYDASSAPQPAPARDATKPEQMSDEEYVPTPSVEAIKNRKGTKQTVRYEYVSPAPSGPFKGSTQTNGEIGDIISAPFGQARIVSVSASKSKLSQKEAEAIYDAEFDEAAAKRREHRKVISEAIQSSKPVSAAAVDAYGLTLPAGYEKQGELYVFSMKAEAPAAEARPTTQPKPKPTSAPSPAKIRPITKERAIAAVGRFASREKDRPVLNFIRDDGKTLVASDGKRLIQVDFAGDGTAENPVYHKGHGKVKEEMGDRQYPNFKAVIPEDKSLTTELKVSVSDVSGLLEKSKQIWKNLYQHAVTLTGDANGDIGVIASSPDESFREGFDADSAYIIGSFDAEFINDILKSAESFGHSELSFKFRDGENPVSFEAPGFQAVIMPRRTNYDESEFGRRQPPKNRQAKPSPAKESTPGTIPVTLHSVSGKSSTEMTGEQIQTALRDNKFLESALKSLIDCLK